MSTTPTASLGVASRRARDSSRERRLRGVDLARQRDPRGRDTEDTQHVALAGGRISKGAVIDRNHIQINEFRIGREARHRLDLTDLAEPGALTHPI